MPLSKGDIIEVTTDRLTYGGDAIARFEGLAIFIPLAAPSEKLRIKITEKKKTYARGKIEKIVIPSPLRRKPECIYFGDCGGCQFQHIEYRTQLNEKVGFIKDTLKRIGQIDWQNSIPIHNADEYNYRLRAQIKADLDEKDNIKIGFNKSHSHEICDVKNCPVLLPNLNEFLNHLRQDLIGRNELLSQEIDLASDGLHSLSEPQFFDFQSSNLEVKVNKIRYQYSPSVFFQGNLLLLEKFVNAVCQSKCGGLAIDLFSGVGLFSLQLASNFTTVYGVEASSESYNFACHNRSINNLFNVKFFNQKVENWLREFISLQVNQKPDLLILDPPRIGASECLTLIAEVNPKEVIYVSCDPTTLARDLKTFLGYGYELKEVVAFDLFPQTYHVESIAYLTKK